MRTALQTLALLLLCLLVLTACTTSRSMASAPTPADISAATPTLTKQQQAIEAAPTDRVELASGHYQLLMFYSPLWITCREIAPIVNGLMKNYTDRVRFVRLNIHDKATFELQAQLGFSTTPEFYLIDPQGHVERKWDESSAPAELEQTIKALPVNPWVFPAL